MALLSVGFGAVFLEPNKRFIVIGNGLVAYGGMGGFVIYLDMVSLAWSQSADEKQPASSRCRRLPDACLSKSR
jgi:hypothetical protein